MNDGGDMSRRRGQIFVVCLATIGILLLGFFGIQKTELPQENSALPLEFYVVGDSLGVATDPYLRQYAQRDGVNYTFVGSSGASIDAGMAAVLQHRPSPNALVVISLGTNEPIDNPSRFAGFVEYVARFFIRYDVYWININTPLCEENNEIIKEAAGQWSHIHYVDWKTFAEVNKISPIDQVHYDDAGNRIRAEFIYDIYRSNVGKSD